MRTLMLLFLFVSSSYVFAAERTPNRDPIVGGIEFERSCAQCHGFNGRGNGVRAQSLEVPPPDLTQLAKRHNGHFPFVTVYQVIDGSRLVGMHGDRDMPIWGDRYRAEGKKYGTNEYLYARGLILELIDYLISIQEQAE